jgi:ParB-like chromosome segregation protein Spo0J
MRVHENLQVVSSPIDEIERHPDNANESDIQALTESIEISGFYAPVLVQASTGYILAGNHRWEVMKAAGEESIPVIFLDVDDIEAKRIMVADNKITRLGIDDPTRLAQLLDAISESDEGLLGTGFDAAELQTLLDSLDERLDFEAEPAGEATHAKDELYDVYPERSEDGDACTAITIEPRGGTGEFTSTDYNRIRQALGLKRVGQMELDGFEIGAWR